ncbi:MAG: hypothetical protein WBP45_07235 [Daejeonella sp.]
MKKLVLFLIPSALLFSTCIGQQKFNKPEVKAESIIFKCERINDPSSKTIGIHNKSNYLEESQKNHFGELLNNIQLLNRTKFTEAFWNAFGEVKLKELLPERNIPITFYINKTGKIIELSYILKKNTLITPRELEKLENNIIKNVSFRLRPEEIVKGDYFFLVMNTNFQKIVNKD